MDIVAFLVCFAVCMINLFGRGEPNPIVLASSLIGLGLCAIAGALFQIKGDKK